MTKYIDYEQLETDKVKLLQFVKEELEVTQYEQMVKLLKWTLQALEPEKPKKQAEKPDYFG